MSQPRCDALPGTTLVTCIMPTRNRRRFVPHAIECFLAQDYPHLELLVADDGEDAIADLLPADPRVRYLRMDPLPPSAPSATSPAAPRAARSSSTGTTTTGRRHGGSVIRCGRWPRAAPTSAGWRASSSTTRPRRAHGIRVSAGGPGVGARRARSPTARRSGRRTRFLISTSARTHVSSGANAASACNGSIAHDFFVGTIHGSNTSPKRTGDGRWRTATADDVARTVGAAWDRYCRALGAVA